MNSIKEKLERKEKELKLYEIRFNLLKSGQNSDHDKIPNNIINPNINYNMDEYLKNFIMKKYNKNNNYKILRHEIEEYDFTKYEINNLKELQKTLLYLFNRYSYLVNDILEDKWILYNNNDNQNKYELIENQFILDNSLFVENKNDQDLIFFVKNVMNIGKILAKKINYKMYTKFYDDEYHNICWMIFIFTKISENQ